MSILMDFETNQAELAVISEIISVLGDVGHALSDNDRQQAIDLLNNLRECATALMQHLSGIDNMRACACTNKRLQLQPDRLI